MQLWFSRIQTAPQATSSWRRCGSRFSRWSQSHAGFESVNLLQHPVRANRTSKMWLMWLRIIPSFQRCTVLWEKSPRSVRKLCKNSCNGNYETPCTYFGAAGRDSVRCVIFASNGAIGNGNYTLEDEHIACVVRIICSTRGTCPEENRGSIVVVFARYLNLALDGRYTNLLI